METMADVNVKEADGFGIHLSVQSGSLIPSGL